MFEEYFFDSSLTEKNIECEQTIYLLDRHSTVLKSMLYM